MKRINKKFVLIFFLFISISYILAEEPESLQIVPSAELSTMQPLQKNNRLVREPHGSLTVFAFFRAKALQKCGFNMKLFDKLKLSNDSNIRTGWNNFVSGIVNAYKAIENAVVAGYKAVEGGVVNAYRTIENWFTTTFNIPVLETPDLTPFKGVSIFSYRLINNGINYYFMDNCNNFIRLLL